MFSSKNQLEQTTTGIESFAV